MQSNWNTTALIIGCIALCQSAQVQAQAPLSSADYLKLMEQANAAAGLQPVGGNFAGAKPRPRGSLEIPPAIASAPAPAATIQLPQQTLPQQTLPQQTLPQATPSQPPAPQTAMEPQPVWFPPASPLPQTPVTNNPIPPDFYAAAQPKPSGGLQSSSEPMNPWSSARELANQPWTGPRWVASYASVGMRRPGDESLSLSPSGQLGTFGSDLASQISIGYMTNPIDCYEMTYLGSLHWNRSLESIGPVGALLSSFDPQWLFPFQNADSLSQTHAANLRQYSLGRRWLTDDIGNSAFGLRVIDYNEQYRLQSNRQGQQGHYAADTSNWLVGLGRSIELWRPISQRVALGGAVEGALYGNFANAHVQASDGLSKASRVDDDDLSLAASLGVHLKARYQLRSWAGLYGGYRWLAVSGLASVDDQALPALSDNITLSTSSDATILFHGFDAGLELKY